MRHQLNGTRKRITTILGVLLCFLLGMASLGWAEKGSTVSISTLDRVLATKKLRIGVSLFTPWTMKNAKGELVGFEMDVGQQLAKDIGVQPEFIAFDWEDIMPALQKGSIDIIVAGMVITPQRALILNFSQPYDTSGIGIATNIKLTKDFSGVGDLNQPNVKLAAVTGTVSEDLTRRVFPRATLVSYVKSEEAMQAVVSGKAHGYIELNPLPTFMVLDHPGIIDEPLSQPLLTTKAGFGVSKGEQDFLNFLNAWITARKADAWLSSAHDYWFKSLKWREEMKKPN